MACSRSLNTRLGKAMLPEDGNGFVEDIFFSVNSFSSSHRNIIGQFDCGGLQIPDFAGRVRTGRRRDRSRRYSRFDRRQFHGRYGLGRRYQWLLRATRHRYTPVLPLAALPCPRHAPDIERRQLPAQQHLRVALSRRHKRPFLSDSFQFMRGATWRGLFRVQLHQDPSHAPRYPGDGASVTDRLFAGRLKTSGCVGSQRTEGGKTGGGLTG